MPTANPMPAGEEGGLAVGASCVMSGLEARYDNRALIAMSDIFPRFREPVDMIYIAAQMHAEVGSCGTIDRPRRLTSVNRRPCR
jgi:hypothetical protein